MRRTHRALVVAVGLLAAGHAAASATGARRHPSADLVLVHGAIYTVNAARSWASAVAISNGAIVFVGDDSGAGEFVGKTTRVVDLAQRMVLPAFHDAHVHPVEGGERALQCDLAGAASADDAVERVRKYAASHPAAQWIRGGGWELPLFPQANPSKTLLDSAVPDRPVYLEAADGHSAWVNSRALALAGIGAATPDPPHGRIERDPATGEPTGTLREEATELVERLLPKASDAERREGLRGYVAMAHRFGITSLHEARASASYLAAYRDLDRAGELNLRVVAASYVDPAQGLEQVAELVRSRDKDWGPHVRATAAKIFADGVIESGTAALLAPYLGRNGSSGDLDWTPDRFAAMATALDRAGFQIHVHAIGDRAVRAALDAIAAAAKANGPRDRRTLLAHLQLVDPADVPRFRELGVVADVQPLWAYEDDYIRDLTVPFLGPERSSRIYPIGSLLRSGAVVAGGSDWNVSSMNPLEAIEVAITRRDPAAGDGPAFLPAERVDLASMLAAYTINGAWADFREHEIGSLEVGKRADLIVLDRNLFAIPAREISDAKVLWTLFDGREAWRDPSFDVPATGARR